MIILIILSILIFLTAYFCYRLAFHAPKRIYDEDVPLHLPEGEEYLKVRKGIETSVNAMLERSFEPVTIITFDEKKIIWKILPCKRSCTSADSVSWL